MEADVKEFQHTCKGVPTDTKRNETISRFRRELPEGPPQSSPEQPRATQNCPEQPIATQSSPEQPGAPQNSPGATFDVWRSKVSHLGDYSPIHFEVSRIRVSRGGPEQPRAAQSNPEQPGATQGSPEQPRAAQSSPRPENAFAPKQRL